MASISEYFVADISASNTTAPPPELLSQDTLNQLIQSNNNLVIAVESLQGENQRLNAELRASHTRHAALGTVVDDIYSNMDRYNDTTNPPVPDSPPPPRNKRQRTSSSWSVNVQPGPPTHSAIPSSITTPSSYLGTDHQFSVTTAMAPPAPASAVPQGPLGPPAPAVQPPLNSGGSKVSVEVGSVNWGKDITGELKALMNLLPALGHVSRNVRAHRHRPGFIKAVFNSNVDAISFVTIWSAGPRPGAYHTVTARLLN
ncbi:hypothetical protein D9615_004835 [Tricholomella constricta]|uniref:Uncharacterized protein n=1 Tax=Tricholomella constricta TaxID=117010 RepID=A0A8H5M736_9AGAR|nr:hypothetical protein D9615_004835 [Tricholomella constricta]